MPDLDFRIESAAAVDFAASPLLAFQVAVANANALEPVFSIALRCQIQLEVTRRPYSISEKEHLHDLFGEPQRWGQTLRAMHWTTANATVPPFTGNTTVDVQVPCTFDFNIAATKYFHGLEQGGIPLCFLFSGTVFYDRGDGALEVAPIPWSKEARFRLPVETWRNLMDAYYPNTAWLSLRRDVFERLYEYKTLHGIPTWEDVLDRILPVEEAVKG